LTAVSNAGPLIHLAKIGRLALLRDLFGEILAPESVWIEAVERGREAGKSDAVLIGEAEWVRVVRDPTGADNVAKRAGIHQGEVCAILLARSMGVPVLLDDAGARRFAQGMGLTVIGSIGVLMRAVKDGLITTEEGLRDLARLAKVMWLSVDVYERARRAIERRSPRGAH